MNRQIRNIVIAVLCAAGLSSCAKWTDPESIPIKYPNIKEDNPALYEEYLSSIRDYRKSEHKVVIAKFDNKATAPGGRAEHINCLPDSIDYVVLTHPDNLHPMIVEEMAEIREKKGIRTLYSISHDALEKEYKAYLEEWDNTHPEQEGAEAPADVPVGLEEFISGKLDVYFSYMDKYGYDGIIMGYTGLFPESMTGQTLEDYRASQARFFDRFNELFTANPDKLLFFEGMPVNVIYDQSFFDRCKYIIADATDAVNIGEIGYKTTMALGNRIPLDRIVAGVAAPSLDDPKDERGLFTGKDSKGNPRSAIVGAGEWAAEKYEHYTRAGICIMRSQNDYYNIGNTYGNIRKAISIMNPSPLN